MPASILLSVAVITRNRPESLERALASLRAQNLQPFEIIVSDDSGPEQAAATRAAAQKYRCTYTTGPRRGLYANRNFAFQRCRGTHIRTMDDDHVLPPGHFRHCREAVNSDPKAIWTTGEVGYSGSHAIGTAEVANQLDPSGVGERIANRDDNWGIADGSTIYPRVVFDRGFRLVEDFGFGSSYLEFGAYLYRHGWRCRCVPGALIEHHATTMGRPDPVSHLYASICYNLFFRPDTARFIRYLCPACSSWSKLPKLLSLANRRWKRL